MPRLYRRRIKIERATVNVYQHHIDTAKTADSKRCMIADAIRDMLPDTDKESVSVDFQTIRFNNRAKRQRYIYLTPREAYYELLQFDYGNEVQPFKFTLGRPTSIHAIGPIKLANRAALNFRDQTEEGDHERARQRNKDAKRTGTPAGVGLQGPFDPTGRPRLATAQENRAMPNVARPGDSGSVRIGGPEPPSGAAFGFTTRRFGARIITKERDPSQWRREMTGRETAEPPDAPTNAPTETDANTPSEGDPV